MHFVSEEDRMINNMIGKENGVTVSDNGYYDTVLGGQASRLSVH